MEHETEVVKSLASSQARVDILEEVSRSEGITEYDLREQLPYARTTVHRNLATLEESAWIEQTDGQYSLTTCGELIREQFTDLADTVTTTDKLQPFLRWIPRDALDIDITALQDANLTVSEPGDPLAMVNQHVSRLKETTQAKAVLPLVSLHPYEVGYRRMLERELAAEFVVSPTVAETLCSNPEYSYLTREMIATGDYDIYVYDGEIPYYIGLLDETVQLGADENGEPRALIETESETIRTWATNKYREYKRVAQEMDKESNSGRYCSSQ